MTSAHQLTLAARNTPTKHNKPGEGKTRRAKSRRNKRFYAAQEKELRETAERLAREAEAAEAAATAEAARRAQERQSQVIDLTTLCDNLIINSPSMRVPPNPVDLSIVKPEMSE